MRRRGGMKPGGFTVPRKRDPQVSGETPVSAPEPKVAPKSQTTNPITTGLSKKRSGEFS